MRHFPAMLIMAAVLVVPTAAWSVVTVPATQPTIQSAPPNAPQTRRVAVFPLVPLNNAVRYGWVGKALQENLLSAITGVPGIEPVVLPVNIPAPSNDQSAVVEGWRVSASLVVYGSYQLMEPDIRIIAKMVDVRTGQVVGSMRVTGAIHDLFQLEEALAQQGYQLAASVSPLQPQQPAAAPAQAAPPATQPEAPATQPAPEQAPPTVPPGYTYVGPGSDYGQPYPPDDNGATYPYWPNSDYYANYNPNWNSNWNWNPWGYGYTSWWPYGWNWWPWGWWGGVSFIVPNYIHLHDHDHGHYGDHQGRFNGHWRSSAMTSRQFSFNADGSASAFHGAVGNGAGGWSWTSPSSLGRGYGSRFRGYRGGFVQAGRSPGAGLGSFYYSDSARPEYRGFGQSNSPRYSTFGYSDFGRTVSPFSGFARPGFGAFPRTGFSGFEGYRGFGGYSGFSRGYSGLGGYSGVSRGNGSFGAGEMGGGFAGGGHGVAAGGHR